MLVAYKGAICLFKLGTIKPIKITRNQIWLIALLKEWINRNCSWESNAGISLSKLYHKTFAHFIKRLNNPFLLFLMSG